MKKFSTNLIVAVAAFFFGLASASALNQMHSDDTSKPAIANSDAMGNIYTNQD